MVAKEDGLDGQKLMHELMLLYLDDAILISYALDDMQ